METTNFKNTRHIKTLLIGILLIVLAASCEIKDYSYDAPKFLTISGATSVKANNVKDYYTYYIEGATYEWTVPSGTVIQSGQGTSHINVKIGSTGGTLSVSAADMTAQITITVSAK